MSQAKRVGREEHTLKERNSIWLELGRSFRDPKNKHSVGKQKGGNAGRRNREEPVAASIEKWFEMHILI